MTDLHPALRAPAEELDLVGRHVLAPHDRGRPVVLLEVLVDDQPPLSELLRHGRPRVRGRVLDVRVVHPAAGEGEVGLDRLPGVVRIPHDEAAHHEHPVPVDVLDRRRRGVAQGLAVRVQSVLGPGAEEAEIVVQDVFDPEEDVAEARPAHERRQCGAVSGDGRRHGLHEVVEVVEAGVDDGAAERLEPPDVQRDVVVHQENRPRPMIAGVADVRQDPVEGEGVEVAAAHLDYRTEATVEGAAPRGFHHIDRSPEEGVAAKDAGAPVRRPDLAVREAVEGAIRVVEECVPLAVGEARDALEAVPALQRPHQLAEGQLPLAAHDEVHRRRRIGVRLGGQARVVAADRDPHARTEGPHQLDDAERRLPLEGHDRQADQRGLPFVDEALDGRPDLALHEDQVGDRDPVVGVDVAGQRAERPVRHADPDRRHVLERVRHRDEKDVHSPPPGCSYTEIR